MIQARNDLALFQFQIGAIRGGSVLLARQTDCCFNSKLVRLEVGDQPTGYGHPRVSIPNWCD